MHLQVVNDTVSKLQVSSEEDVLVKDEYAEFGAVGGERGSIEDGNEEGALIKPLQIDEASPEKTGAASPDPAKSDFSPDPDPFRKSKKKRRVRKNDQQLEVTVTQVSKTSRSPPKKKKKKRRRVLDRCDAEINADLLDEINQELAATTECLLEETPTPAGTAGDNGKGPTLVTQNTMADNAGFSRGSQPPFQNTKKTLGVEGEFADFNDRMEVGEDRDYSQKMSEPKKYDFQISDDLVADI